MAFFKSALVSLLAATSLVSASPIDENRRRGFTTTQIYQGANGTWYENLVVRPGGNILVSSHLQPQLLQFAPTVGSAPSVVHTFPNAIGLSGITQEIGQPDSYQLLTYDGAAPQPAGVVLWRICLDGYSPAVTQTAALPIIKFANGLAALNSYTVLAADSVAGTLVAVNTKTGASQVVSSDPAFAPNSQVPLGINGVKVYGGSANPASGATATLFFTNSAANTFGSVTVNAQTGALVGSVKIISHGLTTAQSGYDDFDIDATASTAYLATSGGDSIVQVIVATGAQTIIAGSFGSTQIAEPTAVRFSKSQSKIYVTTAGGQGVPVGGKTVVGAQLLQITGTQ